MQQVIKYAVGVLAVLGVALAVFELYNQRAGGGGNEVGEPAPEFALPIVDADQTATLDDFEGKIVMLDFWATWCPPCHEQMPAVQNLEEDESLSDTVEILSVNTDEQGDDPEQKVSAYLEENGYTFTTVIDSGEVADAYGVMQLPTLIVIDADGRITHRKTGVHSEEELRALIDQAR